MRKIVCFIFMSFLLCATLLCAAQQETVLPQNAQIASTQAANALSINSDAQPPASTSLETANFAIEYAPLQSVAEQVRELMGSSQGGVIVNEQLRQLEVSAPEQMLAKIKDLIGNLNKQHNVLIDVKVVQIDLNEEHLPGINWSAIVSDYKNFSVSEDKRKFSVGTVSKEDLSVLLEALQTVGEMKTFPSKVLKINSGSDADLRLKAFDRNVTISMEAVPAALDATSKQDRYTARLVMTPSVGVENAVDVRFVSADGAIVSAHIKNDAVAVIGGIFTQTKSQSTKKFPFLGDLPLVGAVFRDQSQVVHRLENIIFLTPQVSTPLANAPSE